MTESRFINSSMCVWAAARLVVNMIDSGTVSTGSPSCSGETHKRISCCAYSSLGSRQTTYREWAQGRETQAFGHARDREAAVLERDLVQLQPALEAADVGLGGTLRRAARLRSSHGHHGIEEVADRTLVHIGAFEPVAKVLAHLVGLCRGGGRGGGRGGYRHVIMCERAAADMGTELMSYVRADSCTTLSGMMPECMV